jgi:apolipoprotein N-acyltransferase
MTSANKEDEMTTTPTTMDAKAGSKAETATLRFVLGIALSMISGGMLLLSFPPYGIWPLAWVAFIPYLFAQYRLFPGKWSSLAPALALLVWLGPFMARLFGTQFGPFFTFLGVLIAVLTYFGNKERGFIEQSGYRWLIPQGVLNWVGFEMIRATVIPLVATSAFIGYTQATQPWITQPVSIFSVYGLNLIIMLVNFALAQGAMAWFDRRWQSADVVPVAPRPTRRWLLVAAGLLAAWVLIGVIQVTSAPNNSETVRVAAIQPNYEKPAFQDEDISDEIRMNDFSNWIRQAADQGAQVIFTPEMAFNFDPQEQYTQELRALAAETDTHIFITYTVAREGEPFRNESVLLYPSGKFSAVYGKNHAPPGEPLSPSAGSYPVFETPLGRLATLICHDGNYTDVTRKLARNGAQLISAGLNEFGGFGEQYWTHITFRAIENDTAFVVASRQTGSAIIDPTGRQVALSLVPDGEQTVLIDDVPLGSGATFYSHTGDILGWLSLAGYVLFVALQIRHGQQMKKQDISQGQ